MASDEQAESEFTSILSNLGRNFDITHTKWSDDKHFEAKFRTEIPRGNDDYSALCNEWVELFSKVTLTTWVKKVSNTGPKIKCRMQFQCWTHAGEVQKELLFDARKCRGTIDIKVIAGAKTRTKSGLNVVVKINFVHLHPVETTKPYAFFVHCCEAQPEPPKPNIQPNDNLPKLIANIVEKGRNQEARQTKLVEHPKILYEMREIEERPQLATLSNINYIEITSLQKIDENQYVPTTLQPENMEHLNMIHINQLIPVYNTEHHPMPQFTVVSGSQVDLGEQVLMCQPTLMYDPAQVIPGHSLPAHFVQLHSYNTDSHSSLHNNQGQF